MTGQEGRGSMVKEPELTDEFPVGMRVVAVDDDPICLKLLENILLRCRYNVTTTSQAIAALQLLRENKDKFDLVISDVHMPDMDGFKLLELVGLEMDLPVIMMSSNDDTKAVMKGITHGACDYLLNPNPRQIPWLFLTRTEADEANEICRFYDFYHGMELTVAIPGVRWRRCVGSSDGWLMILDDFSELSMFNPLTGVRIALPSITTFPDVEPILTPPAASPITESSTPVSL